VNQNGEISRGGINYKIEGFYDVCRLKELRQGVLMPKSNLQFDAPA
jgi:hypothetical protein